MGDGPRLKLVTRGELKRDAVKLRRKIERSLRGMEEVKQQLQSCVVKIDAFNRDEIAVSDLEEELKRLVDVYSRLAEMYWSVMFEVDRVLTNCRNCCQP